MCVCVPARSVAATPEVVEGLKRAVAAGLGTSFRPKAVAFVEDLPKARSMKIMRRVVRAVWVGDPVGDLSGLVNPDAVARLGACVPREEPA